MKKHRAPQEQLIEAGNQARRMLRERGIEAEELLLDAIMKEDGAPILPGLPPYLPHRWTIKAAQRMMYDLIILWKDHCGKNQDKLNNVTEFFRFVIKELRKQEKVYAREESRMPKLLKSLKVVPVLKEVFSPMRKRENIAAMQRFFIDSFAVSVIVKNNHSTAEYANWFIDWTEDLHKLWTRAEQKKDVTK